MLQGLDGLPRVAIILVNWNGADDTIACLDSLARLEYPARQVYVVDNASSDDSASRIHAARPGVTLISSPRNLGYAGGFNLGRARALADGANYLWLLNNDTVVDSDIVDMFLEAARQHEPAILSPKILNFERTEVLWYAGGYLDDKLKSHHIGRGDRDVGQYDMPRRVAWASGCSLFCSAATAHDIGPMDERFFLYLEDVDWCLRASELGIPTWYIPRARVYHGISRSVRRLDERHVRYYAWRNYYLLARERGAFRQRLSAYADLLSRFVKIAVRQVFFPAYRRDPLYTARTRGLVDFVRGRFGAAPFPSVPAPAVRSGAKDAAS